MAEKHKVNKISAISIVISWSECFFIIKLRNIIENKTME